MIVYLFICAVNFGRISVYNLIWVSRQMELVSSQYELKGNFLNTNYCSPAVPNFTSSLHEGVYEHTL